MFFQNFSGSELDESSAMSNVVYIRFIIRQIWYVAVDSIEILIVPRLYGILDPNWMYSRICNISNLVRCSELLTEMSRFDTNFDSVFEAFFCTVRITKFYDNLKSSDIVVYLYLWCTTK
ncbi:hypothetical protein CEXT_792061 [Caerostris extrusa]|uniref:Uncharacterized protein n=1 Tax=Caerostris extrusa TaxID=172846 RepID=A0AAV4TF06_CAEEX|nr:hypothetical protein CEXT_792061 [Caerostris extrusa]